MPSAADPLLPLLTFTWQGEDLYSHHSWLVPAVGTFVTLPRLTSIILGNVDTPTRWRVHAVECVLPWVDGIGEMRPEVTVHLRRLHPHEWKHRHEPTGYPYVEPTA